MDLFKKRHCVVNIPVFMSSVYYVQCIEGAWIVVFDITRVFLKSQIHITTGLSHI
jgi:hypothetical protein